MSRVIEIRDADLLESYRLRWNALLPQTRGASFFHTIDWLLAYHRHYGDRHQLRVLVVEGAGGAIGILPLVVEREKRRVGTMRVLTYPLANWGVFYGPIGPNPTATLLAAMRHIQSTPRDWDLLDLRWVDRSGVDHGRTKNALRHVGLTANEQIWTQTAQVDTGGSWDDYWAARRSHWRNSCRSNLRKLQESGQVEFIRYRPAGSAHGDDDPRWDLYDAAEQIARRSWQGSSETGTTMSHASIRAFLRDVHVAAVRSGCLDLNLLSVGGTPAAFAYNYHYQGYVFGLRTGTDRCAGSGAGTVLMQKAIGDSFTRGDHTYDLGAEYLESKRHWLTHVKPVYSYRHYPTTAARAQVLRLAHAAGRWIGTGAGRSALGKGA